MIVGPAGGRCRRFDGAKCLTGVARVRRRSRQIAARAGTIVQGAAGVPVAATLVFVIYRRAAARRELEEAERVIEDALRDEAGH